MNDSFYYSICESVKILVNIYFVYHRWIRNVPKGQNLSYQYIDFFLTYCSRMFYTYISSRKFNSIRFLVLRNIKKI